MIEARIPNLSTIVVEGDGDADRERIFERLLATVGTSDRTELGIRPPAYQFRLAALIDPGELPGPLLGY